LLKYYIFFGKREKKKTLYHLIGHWSLVFLGKMKNFVSLGYTPCFNFFGEKGKMKNFVSLGWTLFFNFFGEKGKMKNFASLDWPRFFSFFL